jgi:hypothetical protein
MKCTDRRTPIIGRIMQHTIPHTIRRTVAIRVLITIVRQRQLAGNTMAIKDHSQVREPHRTAALNPIKVSPQKRLYPSVRRTVNRVQPLQPMMIRTQ